MNVLSSCPTSVTNGTETASADICCIIPLSTGDKAHDNICCCCSFKVNIYPFLFRTSAFLVYHMNIFSSFNPSRFWMTHSAILKNHPGTRDCRCVPPSYPCACNVDNIETDQLAFGSGMLKAMWTKYDRCVFISKYFTMPLLLLLVLM